jgi:hypothetical protein
MFDLPDVMARAPIWAWLVPANDPDLIAIVPELHH